MPRRRVLRGSVCACVLAMAAVAVGAAQTDRSVLVTAIDAAGAPIKGLTAADFAFYEERAAREIKSVGPPSDPLMLAILVDTAKPQLGTSLPVRDLRAALTSFVTDVQTALPDAQVAIVDIAGAAVQLVNYTAKTADLTRAAGRVTASQRSSTVLFEALQDTAKELAKKPSPRRAIVSITFAAPESSTIDPGQVIAEVQRSHAQYWPITIEDGSSGRSVITTPLPEMTGGVGQTGVSATALEAMLKKVSAALTSQYMVTYASPGTGTRPVATAKGAEKVLVARYK